MKKFFLVSVALVMPFLGSSMSVRAQDAQLPDIGTYSTDALTARLASLRSKYRVNLSEKEKERIAQRCDSAQENLQKISSRLITTKSSRLASYTSVVTKLGDLRRNVSSKNVDTSNIELLIVDYQKASKEFETAVANYETALDDATRVECQSNPDDFVAAIEGVRTSRKAVVASSDQIDELTKSNLNTVFDTVKNRLKSESVE